MRELGHYAVGLRDGGSEWHVGTNVHRQCDQGCREEVEAPERAAAHALAAAREAVKGLPHQGCLDGWYACPLSEDYISHGDSDDDRGCSCDRAAVLAILEPKEAGQ